MSVTTYNVDAGKDRATIELSGETKVVFSFDPNIIAVEAVSGEVNVSLDEGATAGDDGCDTLSEGQSTRMNPIADKCIYVNGTGTVRVWGGRGGEDCPFNSGVKGGGSGGGIDDYTTTERKIGKWIDGSDLYQRTFEISDLEKNTWHYSLLGTTGIDIVDFQGFVEWHKTSDDTLAEKQSLNYFDSSEERNEVLVDGTGEDLFARFAYSGSVKKSNCKAVITIKYIKTPAQTNLMQVSETPTAEEDDMR